MLRHITCIIRNIYIHIQYVRYNLTIVKYFDKALAQGVLKLRTPYVRRDITKSFVKLLQVKMLYAEQKYTELNILMYKYI